MTLVMTAVSAQQKPTTGYAPVNGINMYYEVHGGGEPVVLLHGAFMTITNNWAGWIGELSKTRKVIAVEMQGHGRTADVPRDITYENLADDVAALLNYLKIPRADLIGYSMGGAVAMQCAIRHPHKVRRAVIISSTFRRDGMIAEALEAIPKLTADAFKGSPIEAEYKKLSPTPDDFPNLVQRIAAMASKGYDFGADKLKATTAPMFFIHGDADGVRLAHVAEMSEYFSDRLSRMRFTRVTHVATIHVKGLAIGIDFENEDEADAVQAKCRRNGLLTSTEGSTLLLLPALTIPRRVAKTGLDIEKGKRWEIHKADRKTQKHAPQTHYCVPLQNNHLR